MGFGQGSEWGKDVNLVLWLGPFWPIECTIVVASNAECVINTDVLHAYPMKSHKAQKRVF